MASLCDAFQVPKPLSLQLQPFGKSDDDLGELTFEVGLFFCFVRASRTRVWGAASKRTVRAARVRQVFFMFFFAFRFDPS
jgi:hypothetical protein